MKEGDTPLNYAIEGYEDVETGARVVKVLIEAGADLEAANKVGCLVLSCIVLCVES